MPKRFEKQHHITIAAPSMEGTMLKMVLSNDWTVSKGSLEKFREAGVFLGEMAYTAFFKKEGNEPLGVWLVINEKGKKKCLHKGDDDEGVINAVTQYMQEGFKKAGQIRRIQAATPVVQRTKPTGFGGQDGP